MSATLTPLPGPAPGFPRSQAKPKAWNVLPFPSMAPSAGHPPPPLPLPAWPESQAAGMATDFPSNWPSPLAALPSVRSSGALDTDEEPEFAAVPKIDPISSIGEVATGPAELPDFTDSELLEALGPIMEKAVRSSVYANENGIDTYLEPMLRATIRRALAEYSPSSRPFQPPGAFDRFRWHLKALFTSRTYEDILFEKTRRFQVEEVFLLDATTLALVSFASCDPARHASVRRVSGTAQRLALQLRDDSGEIRRHIELSDHRHLISRAGRHVVLMALVRGQPGELVSADIEFALRRIEDHFREQFQQEGSSLLHELQPFLEDCLLIQSPATAA